MVIEPMMDMGIASAVCADSYTVLELISDVDVSSNWLFLSSCVYAEYFTLLQCCSAPNECYDIASVKAQSQFLYSQKYDSCS